MTALIASLLFATNAAPAEILSACRDTIPANAEISGRLVLRNRKGIVKSEHSYTLTRSRGKTSVAVDGSPLAPGRPGDSVAGTDVTWSDLSLEYLWWDDASFDAEREAESVHGQKCAVIVLRKGDRRVRAWVDRKTGALMQAEEESAGRRLRRLWGTRIKKFGDRWMANVMEVETAGSGHRTKITVEELK